MGQTFTLGRLAGVRIGVNWSVLVILALITVGLARGRFPVTHPEAPAWAAWVAAALTAVAFLLSLLAHELSHAVVARRHVVAVDSITLWLLGGVARLRSEAPDPRAEMRIAGAGPLVSLVLGGLFAGLAVLLRIASGPGLAADAVAWLAAMNVLLAVFNVLPAAPLDGGRLLRALVWWRTGDQVRATLAATTAGRALGWALVALGLFLVLTGGGLGGLWLALIGWFLIAAATAEGGEARLRETLSGVSVGQAMSGDPVTAPASATVADLLEGPAYRYRHSAFPVTRDGGEPVGLVTLHRAREIPGERRDSVRLTEAMLPLDEVPTAAPGDPLAALLPRLEAAPTRRALVLEDGRLVGIVSSADISRVTAWLTSPAPGGTPR
ncbi:site-2 protease family protein [Streptomyces zingiberis]|uniref:Zinc metalloprotease n=1 Tax=Streptomyces zingiberis TaxID=2053010 RepID=A0ABX1BZF1_9ACTN|nr:site-2 protease family protein [Streptomyces zingiberis]NJQ01698.1 CBS domain-containing protein [Streptomyces zingiberis]